MFRKTVVALDLTDKHQAAVRSAAELAQHCHGSVILLHVVELIPGLERAEEKAFYDRLERRARDHLQHYAANLAQEKVAFQTEVIFGHRASTIARFAAEVKADLIVLTSPAYQAEHPAASLGSMAWKVSLIAPCPVLLVKSHS